VVILEIVQHGREAFTLGIKRAGANLNGFCNDFSVKGKSLHSAEPSKYPWVLLIQVSSQLPGRLSDVRTIGLAESHSGSAGAWPLKRGGVNLRVPAYAQIDCHWLVLILGSNTELRHPVQGGVDLHKVQQFPRVPGGPMTCLSHSVPVAE
jgi:hypothetical protein